MTLTDAKILLERLRIPYQSTQYENPDAYYRHLTPFPGKGPEQECPVTALVIPSVNGRKHIELQFQPVRGVLRFVDLYFGGFDFEMFDHDPDTLEADLLEIIAQIVDGKLAVVEANDISRRRQLWQASYDLTGDDDVFGLPGYQSALEKIRKPKGLLARLFGHRIRYEIYDWKTHKSIET